MRQKEMKLNTRQWNLYLLLKDAATHRPGEWISKEEICERLSLDYPRHLEIIPDDEGKFPVQLEDIKLRPEHNSSVFRRLRADIKAINNDNERIQKIVLSCSKGYRLATNDKEVREMMNRRRNEALKQLKNVSNQIEKVSRDGQGRLKIDGVGREFYEAFPPRTERGDDNG